MLKAIVGCLLTDQHDSGQNSDPGEALYDKDYARTLFILVQNPIFSSQSTYTILAHLLQHVTGLPNSDHQLLVNFISHNLQTCDHNILLVAETLILIGGINIFIIF